MQYRREIDGLRAVAVLPVVMFHAGMPGFSGGFLGVDVFFVISGYLITGLIAAEMEKGSFSIVNFYERRARRILPALFLVAAFTIALAPAVLLPDDLHALGISVIAVAVFFSNVLFWKQSGYFGSASEETPLLHTWSLAVEEQFYILFPLFLLLVFRFGRTRLLMLVLGVALASLGLAEWGWRNAGTANFFLAPNRAFELLIGALIALQPQHGWTSRVSPMAREALAFSGLSLLAFSFLLFDETTPHPSVLTLVPVLGTALIIMFAEKGTRCAAMLSWPICVGIGLLSYSIYLWHQPLLAYARVLANGDLPIGLALFLVLLSIALAGLSWRFVERPFRRKSSMRQQSVFAAAAAGTTLMIAAGAGLASYPMLFTRVFHADRVERIEQISRATKSEEFVLQNDCHFQSETFDTAFKETFQRCAQRHGAAIFVTGESHAIDLYNALALNSSYPFIASVSRGYCRPHAYFGGRPPYPCHYEDLKVFAAENAAHIRRIVYTQTPDRLFPNGMTNATIDDMSTEAVDQVISYLAELQQASGVKITILGMLPPLQVATQDLDVKQPLKDALARAYSPKLIELTRQVEALWSAKADAAHLEFVSKLDAFDLHLPDDLLIEGEITYSDNRHLSRVGERVFGARLVQFLHKAGYSEF